MNDPTRHKAYYPEEGRGVYVYDWHDIASTFRAYASGALKATSGTLKSLIERWRDDSERSFYGANMTETVAWLDEGYELPDMPAGLPPIAAETMDNRWRYTDDPTIGAYCHEMFMSGDPLHYLAKVPQPVKPGIAVEVQMSFSANVRHKLIAQYGRWIGRALASLEARGYDMRLDTVYVGSGVMRDQRRTETRIRVTDFGEVTLARDWSALFSPGGWRLLTFMAIALPGERDNKRVSRSLGSPQGAHGWDLDFDPETRVLKVMCQSMASTFPAEEMTEKLAQVAGLE